MQIDVLSGLAETLTEGVRFTQAERAELLRIAQGFARNDSAAAADVSTESILGMAGAGETSVGPVCGVAADGCEPQRD
jgi:hypothetical protein